MSSEDVNKGTSYGQALKMRRICDSDEVFKERLTELKGHFVERGFKRNFVDEQFVRAKTEKREDLLSQGSEKRNNLYETPLVVNLHPVSLGISKLLAPFDQSCMLRRT